MTCSVPSSAYADLTGSARQGGSSEVFMAQGAYLSPGNWVELVFMDVCGFILLYKCADCSVEVVLEMLTNCCTTMRNVSLADASSSSSSSGLKAALYPARFQTDNRPATTSRSPACSFPLNAGLYSATP